jgi:hypothetical protein
MLMNHSLNTPKPRTQRPGPARTVSGGARAAAEVLRHGLSLTAGSDFGGQRQSPLGWCVCTLQTRQDVGLAKTMTEERPQLGRRQIACSTLNPEP